MKYCSHCGAEMVDEAVICVKCGCEVEKATVRKNDKETLMLLIKIFMIIGTVTLAITGFLLPLAWCLPMTLIVCRKMKAGETIGTGMKICSLLFVSLIAGILMLCMED